MKKRALLSVFDKTGIIPLAEQLTALGYDIISTGGTSKILEDAMIPVIRIEDLTGFEAILGGRVKTLHPKVFGGILARRDDSIDMKTLEDDQIMPIDLVVVNLYPFLQALKLGKDEKELIEMMDIGGVSLVRAAAKNYPFVTVITDPQDYQLIMNEVEIDLKMRRLLAGKAFSLTASYDATISAYFNQSNDIQFPDTLNLTYQRFDLPRYGENPHQLAAIYRKQNRPSTLFNAKILHGKPLSYNNYRDIEAALHMLSEFNKPTVVVVKHMNPCAISSKSTLYEAWNSAYQADPVSIFGGIVATNQVIDVKTAKELNALFLEIIIAQGYDPDALDILKQKKNVRIISSPNSIPSDAMELVSIDGGLLYQEKDNKILDQNQFSIVTLRKPSDDEMNDLLFSMRVVKHVKSNAIVIAKDETSLGIGAGQMNRVGAVEIGIKQAGIISQGAVLASDGFIPMTDTVTLAQQAGITAIIQPGGSIADPEIIKWCNTYQIAMVFTHQRHFKH